VLKRGDLGYTDEQCRVYLAGYLFEASVVVE
jgi:hypothetical protein